MEITCNLELGRLVVGLVVIMLMSGLLGWALGTSRYDREVYSLRKQLKAEKERVARAFVHGRTLVDETVRLRAELARKVEP